MQNELIIKYKQHCWNNPETELSFNEYLDIWKNDIHNINDKKWCIKKIDKNLPHSKNNSYVTTRKDSLAKIRHRYFCHKSKAKQRGIEFILSFDDWLNIWEKSGKLNDRGCKKGQYVMSRFNDTGPYSINNVFIQLHSKNSIDGGVIYINKGKYGLDNHNLKYKIIQICPNTNKDLQVLYGASALKAAGFDHSNVYKACQTPGRIHKGYYWRKEVI